MKLVNAGLALALVAGGVLAYVSLNDSSSVATATTRTAKVSTGTVTSSVSATGNVTSATTSTLSFGSSGKVTTVNVVAGETVKTGEVLATIDPTTARSNTASAQAQLASAQAQLTTTEQGEIAANRANFKLSESKAAMNTIRLCANTAPSRTAPAKRRYRGPRCRRRARPWRPGAPKCGPGAVSAPPATC